LGKGGIGSGRWLRWGESGGPNQEKWRMSHGVSLKGINREVGRVWLVSGKGRKTRRGPNPMSREMQVDGGRGGEREGGG